MIRFSRIELSQSKLIKTKFCTFFRVFSRLHFLLKVVTVMIFFLPDNETSLFENQVRFFYLYYILIFLFDFQAHSGILLAIYILLKITVEKNVCIDFELK